MKLGEKKFPPNQTPLQALIAARALIEKPGNWTQREWGVGGRHCMGAALSRSSCMSLGVWDAALKILEGAVNLPGDQKISDWNDTHTHEEVLAAFDRAIAIARANYGV